MFSIKMFSRQGKNVQQRQKRQQRHQVQPQPPRALKFTMKETQEAA